MRKKGKTQLITIISLIIAFLALIVAYFFDTDSKLVTLTATLTAVVGVFAVYIQIRKSKLIRQSSFTIEISKYFYEVPGISPLVHKLGRAADVEDSEYVVKESDRSVLVKYLNYLKTIANLVDQNIVDIATLNNVFAYEFFIVLNNKSVQKMELEPFSEFYLDVFELYDKWTKFRNKKNFQGMYEDSLLSDIDVYKKHINGEVK